MGEPDTEALDTELTLMETSGAFSFFDAIFAVAMTLLVITITPPTEAWNSFSALWDAAGMQFEAFVLSFVIIALYWWANRRFLGRLRGVTTAVVFANLATLMFVVLLPVSTNALGDSSDGAIETSTVIYALNIAAISTAVLVMFVIALRQELFTPMPSRRAALAEFVDGLLPPVVFLLSVPVALLVSGTAGRLVWAALLVIGPISGRWATRERQRVTP